MNPILCTNLENPAVKDGYSLSHTVCVGRYTTCNVWIVTFGAVKSLEWGGPIFAVLKSITQLGWFMEVVDYFDPLLHQTSQTLTKDSE